MPSPAEELFKAPLAFLLADLLKQVNKPSLLGKHGISLTKHEMDEIAAAIQAQADLGDKAKELPNALGAIVQESVEELAERFGFSYEESLQSQDMGAIGGWETTAEFLEIANIKGNAELRISVGASLLAFLGDKRAVDYLFSLLKVDAGLNDVDAVIAKRALSQLSKILLETPHWEEKVREAIFSI